MEVRIHDQGSAPEGSKHIVEDVKACYGFLPHLMGVMAGAPSLLKAYMNLQTLFDETSLSPEERLVVLLEASVTNGCEYCVAAHSVVAERQGARPEVVAAIRDSGPIPDARLQALRELTREVVASRGWPSDTAVGRFEGAGYTPQQLLEVILGVGMKTLSNYTNHAAGTPLDAPFAAAAWRAPSHVKPSPGPTAT